jgi:ABC-2 type transport system ATP-binding protein
MIEFNDVTRTYGERVAVSHLSLTVRAGELFCFLGPNGAGKTTSIKMLVGLLRPTSGALNVCGHNLTTQHREAAQSIGYVPDEPYLYDKLTGREFLQFVAGMYGMSRADEREGIAENSAALDLGGFVDDLTETYSHGMKQRLVFAAALLHRPPVLVIDEPLVGLDPRTARIVKDLMRKKADEGATVFVSTHSLAMVEEIADRIGILDHGCLRAMGTLEELRASMTGRDTSLESLFLELTAGPNGAG